MRLLCDANVARTVAEALREAGHDVVRVSEVDPTMRDADVLGLAREERRILVTHDKDFGELVYVRGQIATGVMLLRLSTGDPKGIGETAVSVIDTIGSRLEGSFAVVTDSRV